jgi:hypothetical protein
MCCKHIWDQDTLCTEDNDSIVQTMPPPDKMTHLTTQRPAMAAMTATIVIALMAAMAAMIMMALMAAMAVLATMAAIGVMAVVLS